MSERCYREAEARLFDDAGIDPQEAWLNLPRVGVRSRVLEAGEGHPVVFLHGGPMAAATWAYVVANLDGMRAILVDRPGCGLSEAPTQIPDPTTLPMYVEQLTEDVLDALDLTEATLVGSSLGGYSALRSAAALPDRVRRVFLAGCPPFVPGWTQIPFFTMLRVPLLGRLLPYLPATSATVRIGLRQMGQTRSLIEGEIPVAMLDWELAWQRHTNTLRNDARMIRRCGTLAGGFDRRLDLSPEDLDQIHTPVHILIGSSDPIGGADVGRDLERLIPNATLEIWDGAGHLPWLDDPSKLARSVRSFVGRPHRTTGGLDRSPSASPDRS
jgi:pimeloyl-ACP methyl ester carboxylesterase